MIEIDHVSYTYPNAQRPAIHDLTLTIEEGEFWLVCGPSGAGKSTVLRLLNGLVPHFHGGRIAGQVRVWGRSTLTHQPRDMADLVGFVFQDPEAQFVVEVVEDEIVFAMENLGLPSHIMRRRVEEVLDQLGIAHLRRRSVATLSGGERQRVAIAAVLAAQPRALVLDEPTSQLDPHAAEEVLTALQKLNADLGLTVVLSEHRLERVVQYVDRMLYLPGPAGTASQPLPLAGPPREVLAQVDLVPPLVALGKVRGWHPLPLTLKEGRRFAKADRELHDAQRGPKPDAEASDLPSERRLEGLQSRQKAQLSPAQPAIVLSYVHFAYGQHEALYDLSLVVRAGEVLALMGRNGSGKTTLLKLIVGLLKPQRGSVTVLGHDVARMDVEQVAAFVGYVPQDPRALLFHDTLWEELAFTLMQKRSEMSDWRSFQPQSPIAHLQSPSSQIGSTLEQLGLAPLAGAYPRNLSGGEAQRAALAAILVGNPKVLLLDEPTRGLDYRAKSGLGRLLRALAAEQRTILLATHDVELVAAYADRVALLGDGELVVEGPVREVLSDSLIFSSQIAKLFPGTGWLTVEDVPGHA
jgi:energy-coupling factor transport system ATP-binding protein